MTDDTTTPQTNATFVCPVEDCRALIPDTLEDQRAHRRGHEHRDKVEEAMRTAIRLVKSDFRTLRGETRDAVKKLEREVSGVDSRVRTLPAPPPPTQVRRGGWDDLDEEAPADTAAAEVEDDWADLLQPAEEPEQDPDEDPDLEGQEIDDEDEITSGSVVPTPADVPAWKR
jgi:hypothetical protein